MPKNEFDFEDPLELNGVGLDTSEDTTHAMCECFIEEFLRMGYHPDDILALFRNPHYLGMNLVWQRRGEPFVRASIAEVFARWGRPVTWAETHDHQREEAHACRSEIRNPKSEIDQTLTDPMGAPIPKLHW